MKPQVFFDRSAKRGINSKESYIIFPGNEVFLRLVGGASDFDLLTATAGEDRGKLIACVDQDRLRDAAVATAGELKCTPIFSDDRFGRPYVKIRAFRLLDQSEATRSQASSFIEEVCDIFFAIYDQSGADVSRSSDLDEIYDVLAIDDSGSDVYLSDGLWLSSNGSIRDLGR